mmetsp:Transcript_17303/g.31050  ORF Transcript_17303/g.31050 Transcript_17303/m.31050 type:complete len:200 (-) Transcript_17303:84-683(-)
MHQSTAHVDSAQLDLDFHLFTLPLILASKAVILILIDTITITNAMLHYLHKLLLVVVAAVVVVVLAAAAFVVVVVVSICVLYCFVVHAIRVREVASPVVVCHETDHIEAQPDKREPQNNVRVHFNLVRVHKAVDGFHDHRHREQAQSQQTQPGGCKLNGHAVFGSGALCVEVSAERQRVDSHRNGVAQQSQARTHHAAH